MKHVLITGATGVLGSELVPRFVRDPDVTVHLLIRANDKTHLHARLVDLFQYWELSPDDPRAQQIRAYQGDVCADQLGVSDELYRRFQSLLTHIVHSAGNVKLNQPVAAARQHAVGSVRNILALTNACQTNGQFEKLDAVSTIGVAGMRSGMIQEVRLPTPERGYRNTYEQAKAEAEEILWQASADGSAELSSRLH